MSQNKTKLDLDLVVSVHLKQLPLIIGSKKTPSHSEMFTMVFINSIETCLTF